MSTRARIAFVVFVVGLAVVPVVSADPPRSPSESRATGSRTVRNVGPLSRADQVALDIAHGRVFVLRDGVVRSIDLATGQVRGERDFGYAAIALAIGPGGRTLVVYGQGLALVDAETLSPRTGSDVNLFFHSAALSPDERTVAGFSMGQGVVLLDATSGHGGRLLPTPVASTLRFSDDSRRLAVGMTFEPGYLFVLRSDAPGLAMAPPTGRVSMPRGYVSVSFALDSRAVVAATTSSSLEVVDVESGRLQATLRLPDETLSVVASFRRHYVLGVTESKRVLVWDLRTNRLVRELSPIASPCLSARTSPDGRSVWLVLASGDLVEVTP